MMILLSSFFFIAWSSVQMTVQYVKDKKRKIIEKNDSEENCSEEQSLQNEVETSRTDENLSDENNSDGDGDQPCSDSDLNVSKSFKRLLDKHDASNSDCYNSSLESEEVFNIDMTNQSRRSSNSVKQNCISSTSNEGEVFYRNFMDHLEQHDIKFADIHDSTLTIIVEENDLNVSNEDTNNDKPKNTLPVSNTDSINQQQCQNKNVDSPT